MQGISVYERGDRPTYYVAYDCPIRARRVCESSGILKTDPRGKLAAYAYAREKSRSGIAHGLPRDASRWEHWVESWLRMRFANQPRTLTSYLGAWKFLSFWLHEHQVTMPRLLKYEHAVSFVTWRESQVRRSGKRTGRNTALHNCKVMSRIMREAVRRDYAAGNPWFRLSEDIPAAPTREKPMFTHEQVAMIRAELRRRAGLGRPSDWMPIAFEIALHQACRLAATQIPMERIDLERNTIQFHEKGGKVFTVEINKGLRPLLAQLKAEGRAVTCTLPRFASRNFSRVLRAIGLPHSFHCTRVTGISLMARNGVPEQKARAAVCHGSWAVHKGYQRLRPADAGEALAVLDFSSAGPVCVPARSRGGRLAI